ncbi:hypothetical protein F5Y17DRAFT_478261 [Xylariaceae sp. FL0594]|nr:hypothetical protein F5Y17DRAFT_478261 [Xylariaceae sp. FL0594]
MLVHFVTLACLVHSSLGQGDRELLYQANGDVRPICYTYTTTVLVTLPPAYTTVAGERSYPAVPSPPPVITPYPVSPVAPLLPDGRGYTTITIPVPGGEGAAGDGSTPTTTPGTEAPLAVYLGIQNLNLATIDGFVTSSSTEQEASDCSRAQIFLLGNGRLLKADSLQPVGAYPGAQYVGFRQSVPIVGNILAKTFSSEGGFLTWTNDVFYSGAAGFCRGLDGDVECLSRWRWGYDDRSAYSNNWPYHDGDDHSNTCCQYGGHYWASKSNTRKVYFIVSSGEHPGDNCGNKPAYSSYFHI